MDRVDGVESTLNATGLQILKPALMNFDRWPTIVAAEFEPKPKRDRIASKTAELA